MLFLRASEKPHHSPWCMLCTSVRNSMPWATPEYFVTEALVSDQSAMLSFVPSSSLSFYFLTSKQDRKCVSPKVLWELNKMCWELLLSSPSTTNSSCFYHEDTMIRPCLITTSSESPVTRACPIPYKPYRTSAVCKTLFSTFQDSPQLTASTASSGKAFTCYSKHFLRLPRVLFLFLGSLPSMRWFKQLTASGRCNPRSSLCIKWPL